MVLARDEKQRLVISIRSKCYKLTDYLNKSAAFAQNTNKYPRVGRFFASSVLNIVASYIYSDWTFSEERHFRIQGVDLIGQSDPLALFWSIDGHIQMT